MGSCPFFFSLLYVRRVCRVIPCPILLVRASCIACHGSTAKTGNTTKRSRVSNSRTISGLSDGFKPLRHTGMNLTTPFTLPFCTPPHAYTPSPCSCQRCKMDNQCPKLFSSDNMYPGSVPAELQRLSQTEEMLIARSCPIMRVIHLKGGQLGSDARPNQLQQKSPTGSLAPAVPVAITPTFSPWTHTSDDSYIYQLSLVLSLLFFGVSYLAFRTLRNTKTPFKKMALPLLRRFCVLRTPVRRTTQRYTVHLAGTRYPIPELSLIHI